MGFYALFTEADDIVPWTDFFLCLLLCYCFKKKCRTRKDGATRQKPFSDKRNADTYHVYQFYSKNF